MIPKIGIGPLSSEIIDSVFRYAQETYRPMMLIASKNQVDYDYGYVYNTKGMMEVIESKRWEYPQAVVWICRDHCGPGFNGENDINDTYRTIQKDIKCGFDLIHLDFCHFEGTHQEKLDQTVRAAEYARHLNPNIKLEIGTDENTGDQNLDFNRLYDDLKFFLPLRPTFYVVQTGSLIKEDRQVGSFNEDVRQFAKDLRSFGIGLKEHNADFLTPEEISLRKGIVTSMNISPEFGILQTRTMLEIAEGFGIDTQPWLQKSYNSWRWEKWMISESDFRTKAIIAGHYNYNYYEKEYHKLRLSISQKDRTILEETLYTRLKERFDAYHS